MNDRPRLEAWLAGALLIGPLVAACSSTGTSASPPTAAHSSTLVTSKADAGLVTRADLGSDWPLTVDKVYLACRPLPGNLQILTVTAPDGTTYGLNGVALDHNYPRIDPIWAADPGSDGLKLDMSPLMDKASALC